MVPAPADVRPVRPSGPSSSTPGLLNTLPPARAARTCCGLCLAHRTLRRTVGTSSNAGRVGTSSGRLAR